MTKRPNFINYRMASSPVEGVIHPAARATPPPPIGDPNEQGSVCHHRRYAFRGRLWRDRTVPQRRGGDEYADSDHDLQDSERHIADLIAPAPESDDYLITLAELEYEEDVDDE
jgi:hypothetical protein